MWVGEGYREEIRKPDGKGNLGQNLNAKFKARGLRSCECLAQSWTGGGGLFKWLLVSSYPLPSRN